MLYYIIKFIRLMLNQPLELLKHLRDIKYEMREAKINRHVNEVTYVSTKFCELCHQPHMGGMISNEKYCVNDHVGRVVVHLNNAVYSIDIAIYAMSSDPIGEALREAESRGVRVRLICEKNFVRLISKYADCMLVRKVPPSAPIARGEVMMHHKFCIIDGYEAVDKILSKDIIDRPIAVCMSGSLNWVSHAKSYDDMLITSSPKIARRLEQEFVRIWNLTKTKKIQ